MQFFPFWFREQGQIKLKGKGENSSNKHNESCKLLILVQSWCHGIILKYYKKTLNKTLKNFPLKKIINL